MGNHRTLSSRGRLGRLRRGGAPNLSYVTNLNSHNVTKARAGYTAMKSGSRNMRIAVVGSSVERGVDETALPYNEQYARSLTRGLADMFNDYGIPAGDNSWFGISGTSLADYKLRDKRLTTGGTTALGSGVVQGGASLSMSSATATMSFTPVGNVDTAVIWTLQNSAFNGATLNVKVDGVSTTNIVQNTTNTMRKTVVSLGTLGTHTITIDWVSGANGLYGIECYDSTRKEVTFRNWSQSGGTASQMVDNTGSPSAGRINQMNLDPVDLLIAGGELVNSWRNGTAVATVKAQAEQLMDACKAAGTDYLFLVPPFDSGSAGNTATQQDYIDAVKASCVAKGLPYLDAREATEWASKANSDIYGYTSSSDFVHLTIAGQVARAQLLRDAVLYFMGFPLVFNSQLLVALGQSAMVAQGISGSSGLPAGWTDTPRVKIWGGSSFTTYSPAAAANWGPEVPYAKAWLDANPSGTLYIVKSAVGNTQLGAISTYGAANGATQDWSKGGALYPPAKDSVLAAKAALPKPVNVTTLWIQGETDAMAANLAADYRVNLGALFARMRIDFDAGRIIYSTANESRAWLRKDEIIAAQIANETWRNRCITGDNLPLQSDHWHWTAPSVNNIGAALFAANTGEHTANRTNTLSGIVENCDPLISISNGFLTATALAGINGNGAQAIGKRGATSGKKFFAARVGATPPSTGIAIGFVNDTFAVATTWFGSDTKSVCLYGNGNVAFGGAAVLTDVGGVAAGDLLQARWDSVAGTVAFQINNNGWTTDVSVPTLTGTIYPALGLLGAGEALTLDNSVTPPAGYSYFGG